MIRGTPAGDFSVWDVGLKGSSPDIECKCLRMTRKYGIILSPVRKRGVSSGIFQRVGVMNIRDRDIYWRPGVLQREFDALDWKFEILVLGTMKGCWKVSSLSWLMLGEATDDLVSSFFV